MEVLVYLEDEKEQSSVVTTLQPGYYKVRGWGIICRCVCGGEEGEVLVYLEDENEQNSVIATLQPGCYKVRVGGG